MVERASSRTLRAPDRLVNRLQMSNHAPADGY